MRRSEASPRPRRRLLLTVSGASVVLAITAGAVVWTGRHGQESRASADENVHVTTAVVERADLSDTRTLGGTLGHGRSRVVRSGKEGLVTWLPRIGAEVTRGGQLFRVNDNPVPLLYGSTPLYRTLRDEGTVGRDVKVLVDNLRKLGYDFGEQPEVGSWVRPRPAATPASDGAGAEGETASADAASGESAEDERASGKSGQDAAPSARPTAADSDSDSAGAGSPAASPSPAPVQVRRGEGVLTSGVIAALKRWQSRTGAAATGELGPGDAIVLSGAVRVGGLLAEPGDATGGDLLSVTSTVRQVTVPLKADATGSVRRGNKVTVTLPDNSTVRGHVTALSSDAQSADNAGGEPQLTVTVGLDDPDAESVRDADAGSVRVGFTSAAKKDVLVVPVGALLALSEGGYALQRPGGRLLPVETGLFAKGRVEVSGPEISEGLRVVTTS
ncbi:hypothetical protein [Streptomyces phaeochromogenes]|uniref:hypothetical protein n=1 Tax=Streptomyces phaeochromogenes TaxID=1923 RepID=UPI002DD7A3F0|nr:hypothetical protein [Streptomyces phaeochromogenes]WRZ26782.1 hypothetical protein OG931_03095 [Streptomyces phaeochromogenes]